MTPKELKALAAVCRQAGIITFKSNEVEFTLGVLPITRPRRRKGEKPPTVQVDGPNGKEELQITSQDEADINQDELTADQALFWSSGETPNEEGIV